MKFLRIITVLLFVSIIVVPICCFNTTPDAISLIDNRKLTTNPLKLEGDLTKNIENYVNDRIGLRDEAITAFTVLNDRLFGKMVHPSYSYGKNGYVFGNGLTTYNNFGAFHIAFADMVSEIQKYCEERNVPFLFVFNPAKPAVYQEQIANGINYNRQWVDLFLAELDKRGVKYVDNTQTLIQLKENGVDGFNQKYDANHWNDLGAFYGTQAMLQRLKEQCSNIHINELEEFTVGQTLRESLLVSKFPISEHVPSLSLNVSVSNLYNKYFSELNLHPSYRGFGYYVNNAEAVKNTPKALVFQGSYMNSYGTKCFQNAFREYIHIHDYQNVIDFPYYFNIFQPECVIFEVAEYTFQNKYFDYQKMCEVNFNPSLHTIESSAYSSVNVENEDITVTKGNSLITITWHTDISSSYVWLELDKTYDMKKVDGGYELTMETSRYEASKDDMKIFVSST